MTGPGFPASQDPSGAGSPTDPRYPPSPAYPPWPGYQPPPNSSPSPGYPASPYPPYGPYTQTQPYLPPGQRGYPYPPYGVPPNLSFGQSNGMAITSLVVGILALVMCWFPLADLVLAVPALVFGGVGLSRAERSGGSGRGMAIAGLSLGGLAAIGTVVAIPLWAR